MNLRGIRVQLSGSLPEEATEEVTKGIQSFVKTIASAIFREGGTVIHGSHPHFIEPLREAAQNFLNAGGAPDSLTLVRVQKYAIGEEYAPQIREQRTYAAVQIIPVAPDNPREDLVSMREWMGERCDVVVAVGGKWWRINKQRAGTPKELEEGLRRGKPGFAVGAFGGAVAGYLEEHPDVFSRLRNGLTPDQNRKLAASRDVEQVAEQIVNQIKLLPLVRTNVSTGRLFRILALDGGGIRGTFTAAVLAKWDEMLRKGGGNNLVNHFDLVAGTSTGAILAIGLGMGLRPLEMLDFYKNEGPKIFPKNRKIRHWLKSKHDSGTLRQTLQNVFGERTLDESCCRLVIPTVRATHGDARSIVTPHSTDRVAHRGILAVNAALASSAAPTYFDQAIVQSEIAAQDYLDGGVWANNPVLPAIAEAVRHLQVPLDRIDLLNVGTMGNEADFTEALGGGLTDWAVSSSDLFFAAQETAATTMADTLLSGARHLRVNRQSSEKIPLDDVEAITKMAKLGENVAEDTFQAVRSRFLDGFHARSWRE